MAGERAARRAPMKEQGESGKRSKASRRDPSTALGVTPLERHTARSFAALRMTARGPASGFVPARRDYGGQVGGRA